MKMKRKKDKKIDLPNEELNPGFLNKFQPKNLNFEEDQINQTRGS